MKSQYLGTSDISPPHANTRAGDGKQDQQGNQTLTRTNAGVGQENTGELAMIVLHAAPVISGRLAGMSASVPGLVAAQNALPGMQAALLTTVPGAPWRGTTFPVFPMQSICRRTGTLQSADALRSTKPCRLP